MNEEPIGSNVQTVQASGSFNVTPGVTNNNLIKIYLIARISEDAHHWNETVCSNLFETAEVFLPHQHNPWNSAHEQFSRAVFEIDLSAMQQADAALILPPYGNDCAFEVGWFSASGKPVICFVDDEVRWLRDWMVKGGITLAITTNKETFQLLRADTFFRQEQIVLLEDISQLNDVIRSIFHCPAPSKTQWIA